MGRADWSLSMSKSECSYDLRRVSYSCGASRPQVPLLPIRGPDRIREDDARSGQRNSHWALNTIFARNLVPLRQPSRWFWRAGPVAHGLPAARSWFARTMREAAVVGTQRPLSRERQQRPPGRRRRCHRRRRRLRGRGTRRPAQRGPAAPCPADRGRPGLSRGAVPLRAPDPASAGRSGPRLGLHRAGHRPGPEHPRSARPDHGGQLLRQRRGGHPGAFRGLRRLGGSLRHQGLVLRGRTPHVQAHGEHTGRRRRPPRALRAVPRPPVWTAPSARPAVPCSWRRPSPGRRREAPSPWPAGTRTTHR